MAIKRYPDELDDREYFTEIGLQLVFLDFFLFQTEVGQSDWKSLTFPCILIESGLQISWKSNYGRNCVDQQRVLSTAQRSTAMNLIKAFSFEALAATEDERREQHKNKCQSADFLLVLQHHLQAVHSHEGKQIDAIVAQMFSDNPHGFASCNHS
jgi:hypothetical protein